MYWLIYPIIYIYQEFLDAKKTLFCVIKGLFQFKHKIISHWLGEFSNFFPQFFSVYLAS